MTMNLRNHTTVHKRREAIEKELSVSFRHSGTYSLDDAVASTRNCENMIGATQVPLGIAGPLILSTVNHERSTVFLPLATTEGALVASINRGCKAIAQSGGAAVDTYRVGATRGAVFRVNSLTESTLLIEFCQKHFPSLARTAQETSAHIQLTKIMTRGVGKYRFVRFIYNTQDAMGMNMATVATSAVVDRIEDKTGVRCISIAGNYDVDKKPSWLNMIEGRGIKAWAEVLLLSKMLQNVLKTTARDMHETWLAKCMLGSVMSGSMGFNAQFANVVASIFLATGQDLGHVSEGSVGITTTEVQGEDLYVSVSLPDLMVGTVGGGTGLATQNEALTLLGVSGGDNGKNSERFAQIVGGAVLAGEISLLASLSEGSLTRAHQRLARGKT